jgi:hypothetical protein
MAYATYTGGWARGVGTYTDQGDVQHTADPSHATSTIPTGAAGNFADTPQPDDIAVVVDQTSLTQVVGSDWLFVDHGAYAPEIQNTGSDATHIGSDHTVNDGSTAFTYSRPGPMQYTDENFTVPRWETPAMAPSGPDGGQDGFVKANFRGLNALQENNPEGFRNGYDSNVVTERKFNVGERTHMHRPLAPNVLFNPTVVPANTTSPYGHVFASNTKFQSVEQPTSYEPVTPPANFDLGQIQQGSATYSPVVGW